MDTAGTEIGEADKNGDCVDSTPVDPFHLVSLTWFFSRFYVESFYVIAT